REPEKRFASAGELVEALAAVLGLPVQSRPPRSSPLKAAEPAPLAAPVDGSGATVLASTPPATAARSVPNAEVPMRHSSRPGVRRGAVWIAAAVAFGGLALLGYTRRGSDGARGNATPGESAAATQTIVEAPTIEADASPAHA